MRKKFSRITALLSIVAVMFGGLAIFAGCVQYDEDTGVKNYTFENLKVGVISDTQLPGGGDITNNKYVDNFKKALKVLKHQSVNMIIFAGDLGDLGTKFAYDTFNKCIKEVYGNNPPLFQIIMGNHDYWDKPSMTKQTARERFEKSIGNPWTHYKVNDYHFIGASPSSGTMDNGYGEHLKWIEKQIKIAVEDDPTKPIFVTTHNQPKDTAYGSEDWGDKQLNKVFKKYPNVVNLSGHVHYSLLDERSIWQGAYTVINTQSLSYTEMEKGKENGTIPPNSDATPMGYIMDFKSTAVEISRWDFSSGTVGMEQKQDSRWTLDIPFGKDTFKYTTEIKEKANTGPILNFLDGTVEVVKDGLNVTFKAGMDDDFVHSYKIVLNNKKTLYYFSDFYNGIPRMAREVTFKINCKPSDIRNIKMYAVDSYGKISPQCININR